MRCGRSACGLAVVASLFAAGVSAAEDPAAVARGDVDALVKLMSRGYGRGEASNGPSPTARVNRLVAAGDTKLKPVLEDAWKSVTASDAGARYRAATRQLTRFLYSLAEPGKAGAAGDDEIVEEDGVVRVRGGDPAGGFGFGVGGFGRHTDESMPPFASLVKGGKLRKPAKPDVKKALAALDVGKVADDERFAVAQAVGECCNTDKRAMSDLLRRFDSDPANRWLMTALAWSGSADALPPLRTEVAALAGRVAEGREAAAPILATACWALEHLRRDALVEDIGKLSGAARDAALAAAGLDLATALDLEALAKAPDEASKKTILAAICKRLVAAHGDTRASAATTTALAKLLASNVDGADETLRASVLQAAEELFYAFNRTPVNGDASGIGDGKLQSKVTGERVGPYPDMATLLAAMGRDLASGDLVFGEPEDTASLFDLRPEPARGESHPLRSDVACPDPTTDAPPLGDRPSVRLQGEKTPDGIRLTLTNVGADVISVNPVALRYGTAEVTRHEFTGGKGGNAAYRQLALQLGFVRAPVATPADRFVSLAPKMEYSWTVKLRPEHRDVDHICVESFGGFAVRGRPLAPPLSRFDATWVR